MTASIHAPGTCRGHPHDALVLAGHYILGARLGEGGYGEVFEAWDSTLQRSVAIKRIKVAASAASNAAAPAGLSEARIAASLHHAAFVKVHAIEDDGPGTSIVMELVPGHTVKQMIETAPAGIDLADALRWVGEAAAAMADAHAAGLVHGDLKPSNLMVEPGGRLRILDFGLAHWTDPLATATLSTTDQAGTIAYMAPEQLLGRPASPASDVYALGVILYELVCGRRPYGALQGLALAAAQMQSSSATWAYPAHVATPLVALIRAMTEHAPAARPGSMEEVRRQLAQLQGSGQPMAAPPARRKFRPGRRHATIAGALLTLAIAGAAGWHALVPTLLPGLSPALPHRAAVVTAPYSEALALRTGFAALKQFDRPGSLDTAAREFSGVLAQAPDNAAAAAGMALVYTLRYLGDGRDEIWLNKASASAQQALALNPQLAISHVAQGWVLDGRGRTNASLARHAQALQLDPGEFFAWYGKVHALRFGHRRQQAIDAVAAASARFPQERVFADELGALHFEAADYPRAEAAFRRSIALQPDAVIGYANLSAALLRQDRGDDALRVLQQGLQIRPNAKLYGNLGNALFLRGDYVGAAAAFERAVAPLGGAPGEYLNWANLGDTLLWIPGRERQAGQAFDKARKLLAPRLARKPDDPALVSRMALYAARAGDRPAAATLLAHLATLRPATAETSFRAGLAHELQGNRSEALASIAAARRLGYPASFIEAEPDLLALRRDPAYQD